MEINELQKRVQASTVIAEEWTATVNRVGSSHLVHFNYEFRIDDRELEKVIKLNNNNCHAQTVFMPFLAKVFVITKILEDGSIELFLSNTKNKEVIKLAMEDTQSEIIDQMLYEEGDYYQDMRDLLDNDECAEWCESSCLNISILDIWK